MVYGTGIDVVLISRVAESLDKHGPRYIQRVYTAQESAYCSSKKKNAAQSYAVHFAAKEAVAKALGIGIRRGINFKDIEVVLNELGKPSIELSAGAAEAARTAGIQRVHIALSHEGEWAVAFAVAEGDQ